MGEGNNPLGSEGNGFLKMDHRRNNLHRVLRTRPDPNHQKFWIYPPGSEKGKFLLNRFNQHNTKFLNEMKEAINNE